jgi:hypothetical protein
MFDTQAYARFMLYVTVMKKLYVSLGSAVLTAVSLKITTAFWDMKQYRPMDG